MSKIIHGDSLDKLKELEPDSVDLVCTDPPYGYSFMGKAWDKALPDIGIFKECLRVLKPGAFAFVMSAPRSDVCARMMLLLEDAGFNIGFTPIYWTYASGFPKAMNIGKMVDKRAGAKRLVLGVAADFARDGYKRKTDGSHVKPTNQVANGDRWSQPITAPYTDQAKALDGSYGGFQPKPAVEVIIVAMKPLSEKTFVDQALKNGKGITWLDDARIPTNGDVLDAGGRGKHGRGEGYGFEAQGEVEIDQTKGRFPANLLVSDDVLNDGRIIKAGGSRTKEHGATGQVFTHGGEHTSFNDSGSYSRFFSLDAWAQNLPFVQVPKASKREKNDGLDGTLTVKYDGGTCEENTVAVALLQKATSESMLKWSIGESGESITAQCPSDSLSITLTTTRKIIESRIFDSLMRSLISESTEDANLETEGGGSHAGNAESLRQWILTTTNGKMELARGASRVASEMLQKTSEEGNWSESKNIHSTVKPLTLMSYLITLGSRPGDVILDPFLGSGTTAVAAKQLGRQYIGIEREEEYIKIAEARVNAVQNSLL